MFYALIALHRCFFFSLSSIVDAVCTLEVTVMGRGGQNGPIEPGTARIKLIFLIFNFS